MKNGLINQNPVLSMASSFLLSLHEVLTRGCNAATVSQRHWTMCNLGLPHQTTFSGDRVGYRNGSEERV